MAVRHPYCRSGSIPRSLDAPDQSYHEPQRRIVITPRPPPLLTRRRFLVGIIAATGLYTWRLEPTWIEYVFRDLPIANLPPALAGKILIQLSDTHIGPQVDDAYITTVFKAITALNPDIVIHTGDLISYAGPKTIEQARPSLRRFSTRETGHLCDSRKSRLRPKLVRASGR